jgi:hypothetical protein
MQKHLTFSLALLTLLCTSAHAQLPSYLPVDGLVGWWPFNGNANDESGNGNDGVVLNATLTNDRYGNSNSCYETDGINCSEADGVLLPCNISNIGEYSIGAWYLTTDSTKNAQTIFNSSPHGYVAVSYNYNTFSGPGNNLLQGGIGNGPWLNAGPAGNINWPIYQMANWHYIAVVKTLSEFKFYSDGVLQFTYSINSDFNSGLFESVVIGAISINGGSGCYETFSGSIDDIAIYNRALTPQEIQNLYSGTNETVDTGNGAAPLPQGIPYQAAARDAQGQVIADAPVSVRFSLHEGAVDGAVSYSETHALTTNGIGLFNTEFGNGTPEQSAFDSINWAATTKFLQVEIDLGDGYVDMGTTQLLSVPYAFRSNEAARIKNAGLPIFADNAAALAGGLAAGEMYRTATGDLKVVY